MVKMVTLCYVYFTTIFLKSATVHAHGTCGGPTRTCSALCLPEAPVSPSSPGQPRPLDSQLATVWGLSKYPEKEQLHSSLEDQKVGWVDEIREEKKIHTQ